MGRDQFGDGGTRRIPAKTVKKARSGGGGGNKKKGCCPMVAAVGATRRGQFRLASRYARMSVRLLAARAVGA